MIPLVNPSEFQLQFLQFSVLYLSELALVPIVIAKESLLEHALVVVTAVLGFAVLGGVSSEPITVSETRFASRSWLRGIKPGVNGSCRLPM